MKNFVKLNLHGLLCYQFKVLALATEAQMDMEEVLS